MNGTSQNATTNILPLSEEVKAVKLLELEHYCEGVVFDRDGTGFVSHGECISQFSFDGKSEVWATTGAPNGHKILADGCHLVCDASHHAVLHLDAQGKQLHPASEKCNEIPLRGPNDLTLDAAYNGFYFTDPGHSSLQNPIGTIHYVDKNGTTHLCAENLAFPNGILLLPNGEHLLVAESQKNRILEFPVLSPGRLGRMKIFAELPAREGEQIDNQPDGICLDVEGNLYVAHYGMRQVQVLAPNGKLIRRYSGGNLTTSNVAFGGSNQDQLFITGGLEEEAGAGGLFRLDLGVKGLEFFPEEIED